MNSGYIKRLSGVMGALVVMAVFAYLAYTMYYFDQPTGRQYRLVVLITSFMVAIFGKTAAALLTAGTGLAAGAFMLFKKDKDEDEDKIVPTQRV